MKKQMTGKKLRLNSQTISMLSGDQMQRAAGGAPNTYEITDVPPNCGTFNCPPQTVGA